MAWGEVAYIRMYSDQLLSWRLCHFQGTEDFNDSGDIVIQNYHEWRNQVYAFDGNILRRIQCDSCWSLGMDKLFLPTHRIFRCISIISGVHWYELHALRHFLFSCDQAAQWMVFSVRLSLCRSIRPSVCHTFWLCSHHGIIMKFSGVITNDQGKVHAKCQGQRSKVKVTEVTTQLNRFRTVTSVWIHIRWWNDVYSLMLHRRGALLFFKVIRQNSRSHDSKNRRI